MPAESRLTDEEIEREWEASWTDTKNATADGFQIRQAEVRPKFARRIERIVAERERTLLLQFIGSLTLADHLGDVSNDIDAVLKRLGLDIEWHELSDLGKRLGEMGVTTLYGTILRDDGAGDDKGREQLGSSGYLTVIPGDDEKGGERDHSTAK